MNKLKETSKNNYNNKTFEDIKHIDEYGNEYWEARELQIALDYHEWRLFEAVINKAIVACNNSNIDSRNHFGVKPKMVQTGDSYRKISDYELSRFACYLIVQNGNPQKKAIALGQTYFAFKTRQMELTDEEYKYLSDEDKRFYKRKDIKTGNYSLNQIAKQVGVKNFDKFHNAGYRGLYNEETANDIAKRKGLRYREDILDNMGPDELAANLFRISQTEQKIKNQNIQGEKNASSAHYEVGRIVRDTIKKIGGTMPEDLPTPKKSLKELEKEEKRKLISVGKNRDNNNETR